jgi:hypothetical protein
MPSTDNGMYLADLGPPRKDKLLPDYVCGMNPFGSLQPGRGEG